MGNQEFYLIDKLVSVHLSYMEKCDEYVWTDTVYKCGFFSEKKIKLNEHQWVNSYGVDFYDAKYTSHYESDEELLKNINPIGVNKYLIRNKELYYSPKVTFKYVNGDKRTIFFNNNSEAENYYKNIKSKYNINDYLVYE